MECRVAILELIHYPQRLQIVLEATVLTHAAIERVLPGMTERRVAEIVSETNSLGQRLIQVQSAGDGPGDLRYFYRMCHARAIKIPFMIYEHLRLVDKATKGIGMNDAIPVALKFRAEFGFRLVVSAPARAVFVDGVGREGTGSAHSKCAVSVRCNAASG